MELQPRMHGIKHAQGKSGIPKGTMGILHGETPVMNLFIH